VLGFIPVGNGPVAFGEFIIRPTFAGIQHFSNCYGQSIAALGNLNAAASRLGFYSVQGLQRNAPCGASHWTLREQNAIHAFCGG
jgi:hypothetical protein